MEPVLQNRTKELGENRTMNRDDTFPDVLRAFAGDLEESPDQEELDRNFSKAVADGLVSELSLKTSFEEFLRRRVEFSAEAGEYRLVGRQAKTIGGVVREIRESLGLVPSSFAVEMQIAPSDVDDIEACTAPFDAERLGDTAKDLAANVSSLSQLSSLRFLQRLRVICGLRDTAGPQLRAARRRPTE
jgi:hypothetical protein